MGMGIMHSSCSCDTSDYTETVKKITGDPDPKKWELMEKFSYKNATILIVKYENCTNFEGVKILLFSGDYDASGTLDPHFCECSPSLMGRFRPTGQGLNLARFLAEAMV